MATRFEQAFGPLIGQFPAAQTDAARLWEAFLRASGWTTGTREALFRLLDSLLTSGGPVATLVVDVPGQAGGNVVLSGDVNDTSQPRLTET